MRRRAAPGASAPDYLSRFRPADWPGRTDQQRLQFWDEARSAWAEEHGWLGGPLDLIVGHFDARRALDGHPPIDRGGFASSRAVWVPPERFRTTNRPT